MNLNNEIVFRPRFQLELEEKNTAILALFENCAKTQNRFIVSRIDNHVFIKFPKKEQTFWSPQLHLEIDETTTNKSRLYGLFGPNPTVWTFFMFFHFIVAMVFIAIGIWVYSSWSLSKPIHLPLALLFITVIMWFALYFGGRIGKASGKKEMLLLDGFMKETLQSA